MKCPYCDNELSDEDLKCIICGNIVQTKEERAERIKKRSEAEQISKESVKSTKNSYGTKDSEKKDNGETKAEKTLKQRILLLALLLAGGATLVMIGSKIIMSGATPDKPEGKDQVVETQTLADLEDGQQTSIEDQQSSDSEKYGETDQALQEGAQKHEVPSDSSEDKQDANTQSETMKKDVKEDEPVEPGKIMGWVVDAETGKAVQDARIVLKDMKGKIYPENEVVKTDENGSFTVQLPVGSYSLYVTQKDYLDNNETNNVVVKTKEITKISSIKLKQDPSVQKVTEYYILPYSNSRYLTDADLDPLSEWELKLARNEIYARHGRRFKDTQLQDYFNKQSWYKGIYDPDDFDKNHGSEISALEKKNAEFILKYEKDHGYFT